MLQIYIIWYMWVLFLFCIAVNLDALFVSFAYGIKGIKFSFFNIVIIVITNCVMLALSLFLGGVLYSIAPIAVMTVIGASVMIVLGIYNIVINIVKTKIKESDKASVFVDATNADKDKNSILSFKESIILAFVLGTDCLVSGFVYGFNLEYCFVALGVTFAFIGISITAGNALGLKLNKKSMVDLSWIGGVLLILLGLSRLI